MIKLLFILFPLLAFATTTVIPGANTTRVIDNRLIGIATATSDTFLNKGGGVDALIGFEGTSGEEYGRYILGVNFDTIPSGDVIDSVVIRLYNGLAAGVPAEVICARNHSAWKEGTADGTYQQYSSSWHCQGAGTMFDGSTVANADTEWVETGFGGGVPVKTDCPTTEVSTAGYYYWRPTDHVADSFAVTNYITFLFYDTLFQTGASHERCRFATTEAAVDSQRPQITVYHRTPSVPPAVPHGMIRVLVSNATGLAANFPVLITFNTSCLASDLTYTVYDEDLTTKRYWCVDSLGGQTAGLWVASGDADTLYVSFEQNPAYNNCDSVFTFWEDFDGRAFSFTQPVTALETVQRAARDTVTNPIMTLNVGGADTVYAQMREHSNVFDDSLDPDPTRRYKMTISVNPLGTTYDTETNVCLALLTSPDAIDWTHEGRILIVQAGEDPLSGDTIQMEDGYLFRWRDSLYIAFEDKQEGTMADLVGLIVSSDYGDSWSYRGVIIDSSIAIDYESPSSPVVWIANDTINVIYEGKLGAYTFGGVAYDLVAGAPFLARGTTPYNLLPVSNPDTVDGDTHSPICLLGANGTFNDYGMVPHCIVYEGGNYYVNAAASSGGALDDMAWFKADTIVESWDEVSAIDDDDAIWQTDGVTNSDLDADAQIVLINGVYYSYAVSSDDKLYRTVLGKQSATGNPYRVTPKQTPPALTARGFEYGLNSILSLEAEPFLPKNATGFYTNLDSFDVNYAVEIKFKIDRASIISEGILGDPYMVMSVGSDTVINIAGSSGSSWEHTTMGDGWGFQFNASNAIPFSQPLGSARSTKSPNITLPLIGEFTTFGFGIENDSIFAGFWGSKATGYVHDSLDAETWKIGFFAGATDTTGQRGRQRYGGQAYIDWLRVRPWTRPEPTGAGVSTLQAPLDLWSRTRGERW